MTVQALKFFRKLKQFAPANDKKHFDVVEQALEELEQYRALGTVEELKEAREKQIPQKPTEIDEDVNTFECPSCGHTLIALDDMTVHQHCLICGQALKWGEE